VEFAGNDALAVPVGRSSGAPGLKVWSRGNALVMLDCDASHGHLLNGKSPGDAPDAPEQRHRFRHTAASGSFPEVFQLAGMRTVHLLLETEEMSLVSPCGA
jgi:hypothetical protein